MGGQRILDVMTTMPVQVKPTSSVGEVAKLMREQDIGAVVVADGDHLTGIVTDRDLVVRVLADERGASTQVGAAASGHPVCLSPQDDVEEAIETMRTNAVRRVPVVENGHVVGIVSLGDLAALRDPDSVLGEISAAAPNS
jgi:CBS domain-containing protein